MPALTSIKKAVEGLFMKALFLILLLPGVAPARARSPVAEGALDDPPPVFKLEGSVLNAGGHPGQGIVLSGGGFRMSLDALGAALGTATLASEDWRMDASLVAAYGPPGEVMNLRFTDGETLIWDSEASAGGYHLYRNGACLQPDLALPAAIVQEPPGLAGEIDRYLVTATNSLGEEGPLGTFGSVEPRPNPTPCS